jgi:hypothetical protein
VNFYDAIDRLILHFTGPEYSGEVDAAKREFLGEAGILEMGSQGIHQRMEQFSEWYVLSRPLLIPEANAATPAEYALEIEEFQMTAEEAPRFEELAISKHGLFEFLQSRGSDVHIKDLFLDQEVVIADSAIQAGFNRHEIFEARLIFSGERAFFGRSFCFHPADASPYIQAEIKRVARLGIQEREAMLLKLFKMRYKFEHYRHLKWDYIYTDEKRVRF